MAPSPIFDSHVYVFPHAPSGLARLNSLLPDPLRSGMRHWLKPFSQSLHQIQTYVRHLPNGPRHTLEQLGMVAPLPSLLVESTSEDLREAMKESGVSQALVVAHPPWIENEFILDLCQEELCKGNPQFIPAVYLPPGTRRPGEALKKLVARGARALKLHPSADGENPDSPRYRQLLATAEELGVPVVLHTGRFQLPFILKAPELGDAQLFTPWFERHRELRFVLSHMNYSQPHLALDLAEEFANVDVEISWQPSELIGEAVRRLGAERVLYGSDWPLLGHNMSIGLARVRDCVDSGLIDESEAEKVLGSNAITLFLGKNSDASSKASTTPDAEEKTRKAEAAHAD